MNLTRGETDIALRFGRPEPESGRALLTRKHGELAYAAYAPATLAPDSDAALPWVTFGGTRTARPEARTRCCNR